MATVSSPRLSNRLASSINFAIRSRRLDVSYSATQRLILRHQSRSPRLQTSKLSQTRQFSSFNSLRQEPSKFQKATTPSKPAAPVASPKPAAPTASAAPAASQPRPPPIPQVPRESGSLPSTNRQEAVAPTEPIHELRTGFSDQPETFEDGRIDWARSFHGLSTEPFTPEAQKILLQPLDPEDVEIKADGVLYLPEIKYRRILTKAFGAGGWGLAPRGETIVTAKSVTREYALVILGRLVSVARGEQDYFDNEGIPTATEGCKSIALRRCCKDIGIASELWDPRYIRKFMDKYAREVWVEHTVTKKKRKIMLRKDDQVKYPFKETKPVGVV